MSRHWRLTDRLELAWRDWDEDEVVVFSARLGHSLLLTAISARILSRLEAAAPQPLDVETLTEQLLGECAPDTDPEALHRLLDDTLSEFYRIGLAEPMVSSN